MSTVEAVLSKQASGKFAVQFFASQLIGAALAGLGVWVIAGWFLRSAMMVQLLPGLVAMVFSTAACFLMCGTALILVAVEQPKAKQAVLILGTLTWLLGSLGFVGNIVDSWSICDWPSLHSWLNDSNPHPGRMASNSAIGFTVAGLTLILSQRARQTSWARFMVLLSFIVLTLGATGLVGYALKLDVLYSWFKGSRMAILTAAGMIVLGLGLFSASLKLSERNESLRPDERINLLGVLILLVVSLSTGVAGFVALQARTKDEIAHGLDQTLEARVAHVSSDLIEGEADTTLLASGMGRSPTFKMFMVKPRDPATRQQYENTLQRRLTAESLKSLTLTSADGKPLVHVGTELSTDRFVAHLPASRSELIWNKAYWLSTTVPVVDDNSRILAYLNVIRQLTDIQKILLDDSGYGSTGETALCQLQDNRVRCFPQSKQANVYETVFNPSGPAQDAISIALTGKHGIFVGDDYRGHQVIAAYAPVAKTGLAMMLKQDTWEIYQPIAQQLKHVIPVILLLTAAGMLLLRSQVKPLATRLVRSESAARQANQALESEERRVRAVLDNIGDGIITMDTGGLIRSANPSSCHIFGYAQHELLGQEMAKLIPAAMRDQHRANLLYRQDDESREAHGAIELAGLRKSGTEFPLELSMTHVNIGGEILFVCIVRDISERAEAQLALHNEKELLRVTLHSIGDAVISTDTQGRVLYLNPIAQEITGWPKDEAQGRDIEEVFNIINEQTGERAVCPVELVLASGDITGLAEHTVLVQRNGSRIAIEDSAAPIRGQDGNVKGVVIVFHDVTHARRMAEEISYQATHDALTDLVNRREFERRLSTALSKADNSNEPASKGLSLLYLDLDQFKLINDTCGHVAGDQLLIQVAGLIRSKLRSEDTLARLGGDEFAVLLENCPPEVAARVAESIRQTIRDLQFIWQDKGFTIGVSIGLVSRDGDQNMSDLLKAADSACYVAKDKGRNVVHIYREADVETMRRNGEMGWVARIEHALREDRFQLYVQPIAARSWVKGIEHVHYEVLVRMLDEQGSVVMPMAFIPAAERYGLMPRIDRWIVEHALDLLESREPDAPQFTLSINLSATSINQDSFLPFLREQLTTRRIRTSDICFEVTETAAIASLTQSSRMMHEIKSLGCQFSLDDFGSGMSSFAYLKHLPVDFVKIDGGFVKDIEEDLIDRAMVSAINDIAHVMGIRTIAEFVESSSIHKRLNAIGVDFVQGYAIGRPIPVTELQWRREKIAV
ncbi:MAG TPA: EAL domain-containing protein [Rhodocyclaceae bacterium]|nr:EAL domain-containing protein [Rhodocyclaceae bacterium]